MMVTGTGMEFEDGSSVGNADNIWCDVETQRFYCELPELQVYLPPTLIPKPQTPTPAEPPVTEEALDSEIPNEELEEDDGNFIHISNF